MIRRSVFFLFFFRINSLLTDNCVMYHRSLNFYGIRKICFVNFTHFSTFNFNWKSTKFLSSLKNCFSKF